MKPIIIVIICCLPLLTMCQGITLKGTIVNEEGKPVAAATITIKNTRHFTISKSDGSFAINYTPLSSTDKRPAMADSLLITAVGYKPLTISIANLPSPSNGEGPGVRVILQSQITSLSEVIINTGYQQLPKERITGSFTQVNNSTLNTRVGLNILDRLEGIAGGVQFDKNINRPAVTIRGLSSLNGPKSPLVVVDNFPLEGDINSINPADVESITILKDAAAASIWGTRAGNGVIIINTKSGRYYQPLKISYSTDINMQLSPDLSYVKTITSSDFIDVEQFLFNKGFYNSRMVSSSRPVLSPAVEILIQNRSGQLTDAETAAQLDRLRRYDVRNDYKKYVYKNAWTNRYALSVQGGTPLVAYLFSADYDKNNDDLKASYSRFNFRTQNTFQLAKSLHLTASVLYTNTNTESGNSPYGSIYLNSTQRLYPYARLADDNGNPLPLYMYRQTYIDTAGQGMLQDWRFYPLLEHKYNTTNTKLSSLIGNLGLSCFLFKGLSLDIKYQYEKQADIIDNNHDKLSYFTRDLVNRFSQLNRSAGVVTYVIPNASILDKSVTSLEAHNLRSQLNFEHKSGRHSVLIIAGNELRQVVNNNYSDRIYGYNDDLFTTGRIDYLNTYPSFITGSRQSVPSNLSLLQKTYRYVSVYANGSYTYNNLYTFSASARRDASNLFGLSTNDKWNPLWSAGFLWNTAKEKFYNLSWLPYLQVRMTYGFSGNADPSRSAVTTIRYLTAPVTGYPSANFSQFENPSLRWEKVSMFNMGLDFQTKANKVAGSIEFYMKRGTDLFGPAPLDFTAGLNQPTITKNVASITGKGWDISITAHILNSRIKWTSSFLLNYNMSRIREYYVTNSNGSSFISAGATISPVKGKPVYALWSYQWAGLDTEGNPQGVVNKMITTDYSSITGSATQLSDLVYGGPAIPPFSGSVSNRVDWKNFSLTALITYKLGYYFRKESVSYGQLFSNYVANADYSIRWQHPGDELHTYVPAMIYPNNSNRDNFYNSSEILIRKADNIRLAFVNLEYNITSSKKNTPFKNIRLYLLSSDLGFIWRADKERIDPDYGTTIPPSKSIALGIKATF